MSYETSISGIRAALARMNVSANDVANANTEGHTDHRVVNRERAGGGVDATVEQTDEPISLEQEIGEQIIAEYELKANVAVLRTMTEAYDTIIDLLA
jgi:flagellar basal body rod protein FlgG